MHDLDISQDQHWPCMQCLALLLLLLLLPAPVLPLRYCAGSIQSINYTFF
jgi:hypothetical protein